MSPRSAAYARVGIAAALSFAFLGLSGVAQAQTKKPFMDYLRPRPITCDSLSSETWGVDGVLPRDLCNGIESSRGGGIGPEYYYWDAQIIRAQDGKYHMFMSTWNAITESFNPGWLGSDAYHAISAQGVLGPYERVDYLWNDAGSQPHKGHNVSAVELPDGGYAVVVSETRPFTIYRSDSLDGPWESCEPDLALYQSNVSLWPRHDGRFQIVQRNGYIAIADSLCGRYVQQTPTTSYPVRDGDSIYPRRDSIPRVDNPTFDWEEDPHIWRSGGTYHVIYSGSGDRVGYHLYSEDGINDWQDNGYGWSPREWERIFCFEDGTCNQWYKMERPGVVLENGHPTHITWAVADVDKDNQIPANSNHGSKIIVVPFDGLQFDVDFGDGTTVGTGGTGGAGGAGGTATGGDAGSGAADTGGAAATGGVPGTGGLQVTGGVPATGGATTGGAMTGGAGPTGGTSPMGGMPNTGGAVSPIGGALTGGTPAVGAAPSTGGAAAIGGGTTGGADSTFASDTSSDDSGCSCHVAGERSSSNLLALLGMIGLFGARARRRRPGKA